MTLTGEDGAGKRAAVNHAEVVAMIGLGETTSTKTIETIGPDRCRMNTKLSIDTKGFQIKIHSRSRKKKQQRKDSRKILVQEMQAKKA